MTTNDRTLDDVELFERGLNLTTTDGATLGATIHEPHGDVRGNVLMVGAVAVPQRFYRSFARHLAASGLRVLTFDYRGVGKSRPASLRGFRARLSDWAELDYPSALSWLLAQHGTLPTVAVGHSLGGQIVGLSPESARLSGVLTVASMSGYAGNFPDPVRMQLLWRVVVPTLTSAFGYAPGWAGLGEDLPAGVIRQWARWCLSPEYFLDEHPEYGERIARFDRPILAYTFSDDEIAPLVNVRWLHARYQGAALEHRHVDPRELGLRAIGHMGFFRTSTRALWDEALAFLDACAWGESPVVPSFRHAPARAPHARGRARSSLAAASS